jgi:ABC-type transporter MlaC component
MLRGLKELLLVILSTATMSGSSVAMTQGDRSVNQFLAYVRSTIHTSRDGADMDEARARQRCQEFTTRYMEMDAMAQSAAAAIWSRMSAHQRAAYRSAFDARMLATCLRAVREFRGKKLTLLGVRRTESGDKLVATRVSLDNGRERMIVWRLRDRGSRLRAVDIISDGRSTVATAREEYATVLESRNGDIDAFIQTIRP